MSVDASHPEHAAAIDFLLGRIDFERTASLPYEALEFRLDRMRELLDRLGNPQDQLKIIHVAGTKGKGSTAAMVASILTAAGFRTGLFSSPHLEKVEERFSIDGLDCAEAELVELVDALRPVVAEMDRRAAIGANPESGPTYFELTTALALLHFVRRGATVAVLEVGLGGRLDSTNVCAPAVAVITSISFDHTKQLGNTLAEIAAEKAGIVKPNTPTVCGVLEAEPRDVIAAICTQRNSRRIQMQADFHFNYHPARNLQDNEQPATFDFLDAGHSHSRNDMLGLPLPLMGRHQAANAAVAVATIRELISQGWTIDEPAIRKGLTALRWPARVEIVARRPTVVCDVSHNVASIAALLEVLDESIAARRRLLIFATTKDKDVASMLQLLLPRFDRVFLTRYTRNPRSVSVEDLFEAAIRIGHPSVVACESVAIAWQRATSEATADDLICITGSFFLAAEARAVLGL